MPRATLSGNPLFGYRPLPCRRKRLRHFPKQTLTDERAANQAVTGESRRAKLARGGLVGLVGWWGGIKTCQSAGGGEDWTLPVHSALPLHSRGTWQRGKLARLGKLAKQRFALFRDPGASVPVEPL